MAVFDRLQQKIVLRIVYDGPARAGKTTNVTQLCDFFTLRRRSELFTPDKMAERTLFFDWMHLDGGLVAGQQLRCQLVTVPGQRNLAGRRKQILQTADVVVFVCSSSPRSLERTRTMLDTLRWSLRSANRDGIPVIIQANKQDLKGALSIDMLRSQLGLSDDIKILSACAKDGSGVRETAAVAIREGAMSVEKQLMERGFDGMVGVSETAEELLDQLRSLDGGSLMSGAAVDELFEDDEAYDEHTDAVHDDVVSSQVLASASCSSTNTGDDRGEPSQGASAVESASPGDDRSAGRAGIAQQDGDGAPRLAASEANAPLSAVDQQSRDANAAQSSATLEPVTTSGASHSVAPPTLLTAIPHGTLATNSSDDKDFSLPSAESTSTSASTTAIDAARPDENVGSGCVWPSTTGRQVLRALQRESWRRRWDLAGQRGTQDGSGSPDAIIFQVGGFCAKTSSKRRFGVLEDGRNMLLQMARTKIRLGDLLPPRTVIALQDDPRENAYWVWTVAPWMRTLRTDMNDAGGTDNHAALLQALVGFAQAVSRSAQVAVRSGIRLDVHPSNFAIIDRHVFYLDDDIVVGTDIPELGHSILQRIEEYGDHAALIERYVSAVGDDLCDALTPAELNTLALVRSLRDALPRHPLAVAGREALVSRFERHLEKMGA